MWTISVNKNQTGTIQKYSIKEKETSLSYIQVLRLWEKNEAFRSLFLNTLREAPYEAYFWETPPIHSKTVQNPFEFVLVNSQRLPFIKANSRAFSNQFAQNVELVLSFSNLGGDAMLVVPAPLSEEDHYTHLANFVRNAPEEQCHSLWQQVGTAAQQRLSDRSMWISTAGLGVSWLHIRMDSRPKYYRFTPYKDPHFF